MAKLPKQQKALLSVHMLRIVLELFTSTFLVSYILAQNPDNIIGKGLINIGLFYVSWNAVYGLLAVRIRPCERYKGSGSFV